jgi:hypothetical protein
MHDGLELEARGVPTAVVITEPFRPTVEAICETRSIRGDWFVVLEHPIGNLTESELRKRAETAVTKIGEILTRDTSSKSLSEKPSC